MEQRTLAGLGRRFSSKRGRVDIFFGGPILLVRLSEHGEGDFAIPILSAFDAIIARGQRSELFFDAGRLHNYDSALRTRLTDHFVEHRPRIAALHVFTRSRLVAMGVSVANLALGGLITSHTEMSTFGDALDAAVRTAGVTGISSSLLSDP
jgi:hypothetical protein